MVPLVSSCGQPTSVGWLFGPVLWITSSAPGFKVRSSVEAISSTSGMAPPDGGGKLSGNASGLPLLSKKLRRACAGEEPVLTSVMRSEEHTSELQSLRHLVC